MVFAISFLGLCAQSRGLAGLLLLDAAAHVAVLAEAADISAEVSTLVLLGKYLLRVTLNVCVNTQVAPS